MNWATSSTRARVDQLKIFAQQGMSPEQMAARIEGMSPHKIRIYCGNHGIRYGHDRLRKSERPYKEPRVIPASVDPRTAPNYFGVPFGATNDSTCRWPIWSDQEAEASKRLCCGAPAMKPGPYCRRHHQGSRGIDNG